jgi:hypothetical protein
MQPFPEGKAGETWEPSNKTTPHPPSNKVSLTSPYDFLFTPSFTGLPITSRWDSHNYQCLQLIQAYVLVP